MNARKATSQEPLVAPGVELIRGAVVLSFSRLVDLIFERCGLSLGLFAQAGSDRWRTHAARAKIASLAHV
jgi:hypothetical protein